YNHENYPSFRTSLLPGKFSARYARQNTVRSHFPHNPFHEHGSVPLQTELQMNPLYRCCILPAIEKPTVLLSPFSFSSSDYSSKVLFLEIIAPRHFNEKVSIFCAVSSV